MHRIINLEAVPRRPPFDNSHHNSGEDSCSPHDGICLGPILKLIASEPKLSKVQPSSAPSKRDLHSVIRSTKGNINEGILRLALRSVLSFSEDQYTLYVYNSSKQLQLGWVRTSFHPFHSGTVTGGHQVRAYQVPPSQTTFFLLLPASEAYGKYRKPRTLNNPTSPCQIQVLTELVNVGHR